MRCFKVSTNQRSYRIYETIVIHDHSRRQHFRSRAVTTPHNYSIVLNSNVFILNNRLKKLVFSKQLVESFPLGRSCCNNLRAHGSNALMYMLRKVYKALWGEPIITNFLMTTGYPMFKNQNWDIWVSRSRFVNRWFWIGSSNYRSAISICGFGIANPWSCALRSRSVQIRDSRSTLQTLGS